MKFPLLSINPTSTLVILPGTPLYDELKDEEMRIGVLKDQTLRAVDEATAKNLLSQVKLQ